MKKLFTLVAIALLGGAVSVNAQTIDWNFSTWDDGDITETKTIDGLTVVATSDKSVTIDASKATINGEKYTKRLKYGGTGSEDSRNLNFQVDGPCKIAVGLTSSSGDGDPRTLNIAAGTFDNIVGTLAAPAGSKEEGIYTYTGEAAKIYLYSASSGINLYYIKVTYIDPSGITNITTEDKADPNAPVYNLAGQRVSKDTKGVLIQNGKKFINK